MKDAAFQDLRNKLSSEKGDTLVEALVSVLISGLSILMMYTAISAASRMVNSSRDAMNTYVIENNALISYKPGNHLPSGLGSSAGSAEFSESGGSQPVYVSDESSVPVKYYYQQESQFPGSPVVVYSVA